MRAPFIILSLLLLVAGCLDRASPGRTGPAIEPESATLTAVAMGSKVLATPNGHRVNEFWLASDPNDLSRVAAAAMDGDDPAGGSVCTVMLSRDAGESWNDITPSGFHTVLGQADPWITIDPSGHLHATCMEWGGNSTDGGTWMLYSRSADDGVTWTDPIVLPGGDREIIFSDRDGILYYCAAAQETVILSSHDAGETWTHVGSPPVGNCHSFSQGPDGSLYLGTGLSVIRSTDGGVEWQKSATQFDQHTFHGDNCEGVNEAAPQATLGCQVVFAFAPVPFPIWSHAVDPVTGDVYVAFQNLTEETGPTGQLYHVELYRSQDLGRSFEPVPVPPQADRCAECHSSRPVVHVDAQGRLGMSWRQGETNLAWQSWFAATADAGQTWSEPLKLGETGPEDAPAHPGNLIPAESGSVVTPAVEWAENPDISDAGQQRLLGGGTEPTWGLRYEGGHYASMTSVPGGFLPCWIDLDGGVPQLWCQRVDVGGGR